MQHGRPRIDRRGFLRAVAGASAAAVSGPLLAACGSGGGGGGGDVIRLGYVSPETGPLSPFGEADQFVIQAAREHFARNPIVVAGRPHRVEIIKRDSQSSPQRAGDVAADLVRNGDIHMMLVSSTPETTNPVSDQCEAGGMPCVATVVPWQSWFFARGGQLGKPFKWTHLFFFGLEDFENIHVDMWDMIATNKVVGGLFPADPDGLSWGNPSTGFPDYMAKRGYRSVDPGAYAIGSQDFTPHINRFKTERAEIIVGVPTPADFATFWRQAARQEFRPKLVTISKAIEYPTAVEALGPALADKLCTALWWSPRHPYKSSLTGQTAQEFGDSYTATTGKQWTMPLGFAHTLMEVAAKAFSVVSDPADRAGLARAITTMQVNSVVGPLDFAKGPIPGVAKAPLVGAQWRYAPGDRFPFELRVVNNRRAPDIPTEAPLVPMTSAAE